MSTLQQVRDRVRTQLDLDEEDLPNATLDNFIREGFDRTMAADHRWPFLEHVWTIVKQAGQEGTAVPGSPEVGFISRVRDADFNNLVFISQSTAEDNFGGEAPLTTDKPEFFSVWAGTIYFWPTVPIDVELTFTMRGYRKPQWTGVAADELDGDPRLHSAIFHYAAAMAYAQLEDPDLEQVYMSRWATTLAEFRADIKRPQYEEPIILNQGLGRLWSTSINLSA